MPFFLEMIKNKHLSIWVVSKLELLMIDIKGTMECYWTWNGYNQTSYYLFQGGRIRLLFFYT